MTDSAGLTTIFVDSRPTKRRLRRTRLVVVQGADKGKEFMLEKERVTIGRSVICDVAVADKAVSGTHCEIVANEKGVLLRDLESTNGTYVGDIRVREVWLKPGMTIRAGTTQLRFDNAEGNIEIDLSSDERFFDLIGKSVKMREIFATLEKVAKSDITVLIRGETGTGKELVSRAIHLASPRAKGPLVVQDCGAIAKDLIESTLFGHEKGSFTGASDRHKGSFEQADGGTIFLDEIGELDISLQPKLLRVLENRTFKRVGGDKTIPVNVRVVAATNRDLRQMVNDGTFREDLYYRLSVVQVEVPSLRERREDIPLIARAFLDSFAARRWPGEDKKFTVTPDAMAKLLGYAWPGNVREMKNTIERAASLADEMELGVQDFMPTSIKTPAATIPSVGGGVDAIVDESLPFKEAKQRVLDTFEAAYLKKLLDKHNGNITRSAAAAGLTRFHLRELAKRYGIRGGDAGDVSDDS